VKPALETVLSPVLVEQLEMKAVGQLVLELVMQPE
jgi:hypothetical protein